jgi:hypothetical protein
MKKTLLIFLSLLAWAGSENSIRAATLVWTNTNGGDWNLAANWTPAQVPAAGDDVVITNAGTYLVTNISSATLGSLKLGGTNGIQTLSIASLTLTNASIINSNGVLNWGGGDLESSLTILAGGTLTISNTVQLAFNNYTLGYTNLSTLTNFGTVVWAGTLYTSGNASSQGGGGIIYNAGIWRATTDGQIASYNNFGTNLFINAGTLEKISGTGISSLNCSFDNAGGSIHSPSGSLSIGNWIGTGLVRGTATFSGGTVGGTLAANALMNFSANINGKLIVASNAVANWSGGDLEGSLTVLPGGRLTISNSVYFAYNNYALSYTNAAMLTNYGSVVWAGAIYAAGNSGGQGGGGIIYNAGSWQATTGGTMDTYNGLGTNLFINVGLLEKNSSVSPSIINWNVSSSGIINTLVGAFTLNLSRPSTFSGNATLAASTLTAPLVVASNAVLNLSGGDLESSLTVLAGGTVTFSNTVYFAYNNYALSYTNTATLTNYGTVVWAGTLYSSGNSATQRGGGLIYNAGLWQATSDGSLDSYNGAGTNYFINVGTLEKTGGANSSYVNWNFVSQGGTINTPSGYFNFGKTWENSNLVRGTGTVAGNLGGIIASNTALVWQGGDLEGALTVAQGGTLTISNNVYFAFNNYALGYTNTGLLTNYGTVVWAGTIYSAGNSPSQLGGGRIYNYGQWFATADTSIGTYNGIGTNYFFNFGTVKKTGGGGASFVSWDFINAGGIFSSQTNTLTLNGNYDLTGGTLNVGINAPGNNGVINLVGNPTLAGAFSANLNNGFVPVTGSSFSAVTYTSPSGAFTNFDLPFSHAWQTNYGGTAFTLTVLNVRPVLNPITAQNLDELTSLNVTASATDQDSGQSLSYALVSGPGGLTISAGGAISWTPNEAQGPSSNVVSVKVTDNGTPALSATNLLVVTVNEINVPPQLTGPGDQVVNELIALNVFPVATDSDIPTNSLTFALVGPPVGMTINTNTGAISWTPTEAQGPGIYPVKVVVTDRNTNAINQQSFSVTNSFNVTVNEINVAPVLTLPTSQTVNELITLSVNATATDSDFPTNLLTVALVSGPAGLIVATNGSITWKPTEAQGPGVYTVFVSLTDTNPAAVNAKSLSVTNSFQITVNEVNVPPVLTLPTNAVINELISYSATATATDADLPTNSLAFALVTGPGGLTVSSGGAISWTPTEAQGPSTNLVTISVTDTNPFAVNASALSVTNSYQIIVNEVNSAPVLGALTNWNVNPGFVISFTATATDSDMPTNTLAFSLVSPPAGATVNSGSGQITWRPTTAQANTTNTVQVRVTDNGTPPLSETKSFTVVVNPLAPVVLTPVGYANGQFTLLVNGTTGPDYILSASTNLTQWNDVLTNLSPALPFQFDHTNAGAIPARFYRARLAP